MHATVALFVALFTTTVFADSLEVATCHNISTAIPDSSGVFWPGSLQYTTAYSHYALSSSEYSTCAVEPGNPDDFSIIMKILASTRTSFGVKSGGHASNPGFSSTTGVQISLARFSEVIYNEAASTVDIGSGLIWDDVYAALEPWAVNVVGGRVTGVGVGGFTTGGGYSWKSNQYGLTADTVSAYDLVLPNGTFVTVTNASHPDLFWGLKGGFNNFGVVTKFTLKAFPQSEVWGGLVTFTSDQVPAVTKAIANFSANNTDPKASLISAYNFVLGELGISLLLFYDAPVAANGIFDEFLAIKSFSQDISTREYSSLVKSPPANATANTRAAFHTVSLLKYSEHILTVIANQSTFWGNRLQFQSGTFFSYDVEPFYSASTHATPSAYPHDTPLLPLNLYFAWTDVSQDDAFISALKESAQTILAAALAEGQDVGVESGKQIRYPNYALSDTPLVEMYGTNVDKLREMRMQYDQDNVMSLTGGFRF